MKTFNDCSFCGRTCKPTDLELYTIKSEEIMRESSLYKEKTNIAHCTHCDPLILPDQDASLCPVEVEYCDKVEDCKDHLFKKEPDKIQENLLKPKESCLKQNLKVSEKSVASDFSKSEKCIRFNDVQQIYSVHVTSSAQNDLEVTENIPSKSANKKRKRKESPKNVEPCSNFFKLDSLRSNYFNAIGHKLKKLASEKKLSKNTAKKFSSKSRLSHAKNCMLAELIEPSRDWTSSCKTYLHSQKSEPSLKSTVQCQEVADMHQLQNINDTSDINLPISRGEFLPLEYIGNVSVKDENLITNQQQEFSKELVRNSSGDKIFIAEPLAVRSTVSKCTLSLMKCNENDMIISSDSQFALNFNERLRMQSDPLDSPLSKETDAKSVISKCFSENQEANNKNMITCYDNANSQLASQKHVIPLENVTLVDSAESRLMTAPNCSNSVGSISDVPVQTPNKRGRPRKNLIKNVNISALQTSEERSDCELFTCVSQSTNVIDKTSPRDLQNLQGTNIFNKRSKVKYNIFWKNGRKLPATEWPHENATNVIKKKRGRPKKGVKAEVTPNTSHESLSVPHPINLNCKISSSKIRKVFKGVKSKKKVIPKHSVAGSIKLKEKVNPSNESTASTFNLLNIAAKEICKRGRTRKTVLHDKRQLKGQINIQNVQNADQLTINNTLVIDNTCKSASHKGLHSKRIKRKQVRMYGIQNNGNISLLDEGQSEQVNISNGDISHEIPVSYLGSAHVKRKIFKRGRLQKSVSTTQFPEADTFGKVTHLLESNSNKFESKVLKHSKSETSEINENVPFIGEKDISFSQSVEINHGQIIDVNNSRHKQINSEFQMGRKILPDSYENQNETAVKMTENTSLTERKESKTLEIKRSTAIEEIPMKDIVNYTDATETLLLKEGELAASNENELIACNFIQTSKTVIVPEIDFATAPNEVLITTLVDSVSMNNKLSVSEIETNGKSEAETDALPPVSKLNIEINTETTEERIADCLNSNISDFPKIIQEALILDAEVKQSSEIDDQCDVENGFNKANKINKVYVATKKLSSKIVSSVIIADGKEKSERAVLKNVAFCSEIETQNTHGVENKKQETQQIPNVSKENRLLNKTSAVCEELTNYISEFININSGSEMIKENSFERASEIFVTYTDLVQTTAKHIGCENSELLESKDNLVIKKDKGNGFLRVNEHDKLPETSNVITEETVHDFDTEKTQIFNQSELSSNNADSSFSIHQVCLTTDEVPKIAVITLSETRKPTTEGNSSGVSNECIGHTETLKSVEVNSSNEKSVTPKLNKRGRPRKNKVIKILGDESECKTNDNAESHESISCQSETTVLRFSERQRNRMLNLDGSVLSKNDDVLCSKMNSSHNTEVTPQKLFRKSRKCKTDFKASGIQNKLEDKSDAQLSQISLHHTSSVIQKSGKRGRPRKYQIEKVEDSDQSLLSSSANKSLQMESQNALAESKESKINTNKEQNTTCDFTTNGFIINEDHDSKVFSNEVGDLVATNVMQKLLLKGMPYKCQLNSIIDNSLSSNKIIAEAMKDSISKDKNEIVLDEVTNMGNEENGTVKNIQVSVESVLEPEKSSNGIIQELNTRYSSAPRKKQSHLPKRKSTRSKYEHKSLLAAKHNCTQFKKKVKKTNIPHARKIRTAVKIRKTSLKAKDSSYEKEQKIGYSKTENTIIGEKTKMINKTSSSINVDDHSQPDKVNKEAYCQAEKISAMQEKKQENSHSNYEEEMEENCEVSGDDSAKNGLKNNIQSKTRKLRSRKAAILARKGWLNKENICKNLSLKDSSSESHSDEQDWNPASESEIEKVAKKEQNKVEESLKKFKEYYVAPETFAWKKASSKKLKQWKEDFENTGRIVCEKEGCNKALKSIYAMKYHYQSNTCQKMHSKWKCLLCDKEMKPGSYTMYHHMCEIHFKEEATSNNSAEFVDANCEDTESYSSESDSIYSVVQSKVKKLQPHQASEKTRRAVVNVKCTQQDSAQENSSSTAYDEQDKDSSFDSEQEEEEDTVEEKKKCKLLPLHKVEQKLKIFKKYYIAQRGIEKKASHKMLQKWNKELETIGKIICKNQNCGKPLGSLPAMIYHYEQAPCQKKQWKCLVCEKKLRPGSRTMLHHMLDIHFELDPNRDTSKDNKKTYVRSGRKQMKRSSIGDIKLAIDHYFKWKVENFMMEWKPRREMWKRQDNSEYTAYLPPLKTSANIKIENTMDKQELPWFTLKCFESMPVKADSSHCTFFVGGSVWAAAWCPTPIDAKVTQYIALATCCEMDMEHPLLSVDESKGLLQLWDLGVLGQNIQDSKPILRLAISHNHGNIWQMAWCPDGCWEFPLTTCNTEDLPRLGLLAVACADSYIRIYSIPHPVALNCDPNCLPIYCSWPVAVLYSLHGWPCLSVQKTMCTSVSWQRTDKCELIAGGFGNGKICIWNIKGFSSILTKCSQNKQKTILPYLSFQAHKASITCLDWAPLPGGRWLASSAFDADIRVWDLEDVSLPLSTVMLTKKRKLARSIQWSMHWCGVFASVDDGFSISASWYKDCGYSSFPFRLLSRHNSCTWSVSVSDWLNTEASSDVSGEVIATLLKLMENDPKEMRQQRIPIFRTEVRCIEEPTQDVANDPEETNEVSEPYNYERFSKKYGLVFKDANLHDTTKVSKEDIERVQKASLMGTALPSEYPMASINCVKWNPNFHSHLWLFSVGHAGIARLSCALNLHNSEAESILENHLRST